MRKIAYRLLMLLVFVLLLTNCALAAGGVAANILLSDDGVAISGRGAAAEGGVVTITAAGIYEISGTLTKGQIIIDAPDQADVELVLSGVNITAGENAAIFCKNADQLIITLAGGTQNILTDADNYLYADQEHQEPNAALFSKCDLTICGTGSLTVNASFRHGICTKDELVIEHGDVTVHAAMDALRGKDSVTVTGGSFTLTSGGDGIQASNADHPDKGWMRLEGGKYIIRANGDAIQAETDLTMTGGEFDIVTEGAPAGESTSQKGLKAAGNLTVEGGNFRIISQDDGVHANVDVLIKSGTFYIETKDDGIHANRNLYISGGLIIIPVCYEGFEGTIIEVSGGKAIINAADDAISAAGGSPAAANWHGKGANPYVQAWFSGGEVEAVSGGDAVDSNGNIYVTGGKLRLSAPPWPDDEGSLLCDGDVNIYGGDIAAVGCMGVNLYCKQQPVLWVSHVEKLPAGTVLSLRDSAGSAIVELTTQTAAVQSSYTSPRLQSGAAYALYINGEKTVELTLRNGINVIGDDGGEFTGGYHRGNVINLE